MFFMASFFLPNGGQLPNELLLHTRIPLFPAVQVINGDMKQIRNPRNQVAFRKASVLPFGNCLGTYAELRCKLFLGKPRFFS